MGLFNRLFGRGGGHRGEPAPRDGGVYVYLRCDGRPRQPCGEPIRVRIDPRHDLEEEFVDEAADRIAGYTCHKEVLGTRCQNLMLLTVRYDTSRREIGRETEGATLIDAAEYDRLRRAESDASADR